jgi:hypothetical protein
MADAPLQAVLRYLRRLAAPQGPAALERFTNPNDIL